jgi:hypothetical protein
VAATGEDEQPRALRDISDRYAATIVRALRQEYPNDLRHLMTGPDDRPTPREIHPAFYGCFDWHSSVETHWALVRLRQRLHAGALVGLLRRPTSQLIWLIGRFVAHFHGSRQRRIIVASLAHCCVSHNTVGGGWWRVGSTY